MADYNTIFKGTDVIEIGKVPKDKAEGVIGWINKTEKDANGADVIKTRLLYKDFEDIDQITREAVDAQPLVEIKDDRSISILAKAIVDKINYKVASASATSSETTAPDIPQLNGKPVIGGKRRGKSMRKMRKNGSTAKKHRRHRRKSHMNNN